MSQNIEAETKCQTFYRHFPIHLLVKKSFMFLFKFHDDVIKWKHFLRNWPFVRGIHRSQVNSPHKGQWRGALMFTLICARIDGWVNTREAGDLRRYRPHYDVIVNFTEISSIIHDHCHLFFRQFPCHKDCAGDCQWPLKNGGNSHRSCELIMHCSFPSNPLHLLASPTLYLH